ncbi:MAG: hypothetical protein IPI00_00700 [Flavobacteriales bacterium]|nr:hypothetical protein [Flavobacteriales bacterium]
MNPHFIFNALNQHQRIRSKE